MRIFIPTANNHIHFCEWTLWLLEKYWPSHPEVDVAHFERRPCHRGPNYLDFGDETKYRWIDQAIRYMETFNRDRFFLWFNDDYGLFQGVNEKAIRAGIDYLTNHPSCLNYALTWQPVEHNYPSHVPDVDEKSNTLVFKPWLYSINTQVGLWDRDLYLRLLKEAARGASQIDWEAAGSIHFNQAWYPRGFRTTGWRCETPKVIDTFVDRSDKTLWPVAYHNLCHGGKIDRIHLPFLKAEGLI